MSQRTSSRFAFVGLAAAEGLFAAQRWQRRRTLFGAATRRALDLGRPLVGIGDPGAALDAAEREAVKLALDERDADWTWLMRRLERVGDVSERGVDHVFGAFVPIGTGLGEAGKGVGEAIGGVGKGIGEGAGSLAKGVADAVKIAVGAVVIGGIWILRR